MRGDRLKRLKALLKPAVITPITPSGTFTPPARSLTTTPPPHSLHSSSRGDQGDQTRVSARKRGRNGDHPPGLIRVIKGDRSLTLPIEVASVLNLREHWAKKHRRAKKQRELVRLLWPREWRGRAWAFPLEVVLVRIYPPRHRKLDVPDNLGASLKAVRDEVAVQLGVSDSAYESRCTFNNLQERGPGWGVRIELREAARP